MRDQLELTWTQRHNNLCLHLQALETRQVDDSIEALRNWTSLLVQAFANRRECKENGKLFTFLNDNVDLRKLGIKKELQ